MNAFEKIKEIHEKLIKLETLEERISCLDARVKVQDASLKEWMKTASDTSIYAVLSILALGEESFLLKPPLEERIKTVETLERFYHSIGGVMGYHFEFVKRLEKASAPSKEEYFEPPGFDFQNENPKDIRAGLEQLNQYAEIFPVGGAGDRLGLVCEKTGKPKPAACLLFLGKSLLEGLIRDLQGREYLYSKLTGNKITVPVVMMTSKEKDNSAEILRLCEENHWFGRLKTDFYFFEQPLVPVLTEEGHWTTMLKPGGHGVLWKAAQDSGAFKWLISMGKTKAIVRQINNPLASLDHTFLSLLGIGATQRKIFGFVSCPRLLKTAEGVLVLAKNEKGFRISNIEYTQFNQEGIEDTPEKEGSPYSRFPSNTNILYVDLEEIQPLIESDPFPGLVINLKKEAVVDGKKVKVGRLESSMQNLSDAIISRKREELKSFVAYSPREKTLSVTKSLPIPGHSLIETPEGAYLDLQRYYANVLSLPEERYHIILHPAIGPLDSVIKQKIQKLSLSPGTEVELELAEISLEGLAVNGSFRVIAKNPLGHSVCHIKNVTIENQGIESTNSTLLWKHRPVRLESLTITLGDGSEFFAENVTFRGNISISVPAGSRLTAYEIDGKLLYREEKMTTPSWRWEYSYDSENRIKLIKNLS